MRKHNGMRPQDALVLLKLTCIDRGEWRYAELAKSLAISQSEVAEALHRSKLARLVDAEKRRVMRLSFLEFLVHGLKYVFPAQPGPIMRGIPTAHSAPPLNSQILSKEMGYVWPTPEGSVRGESLTPLYPSVIRIVEQDPELYELLALVDAIRVGRAREYQLAVEELNRKIKLKSHGPTA